MTFRRRLNRGMATAAAVVMLISVAVLAAFMPAASGVFDVQMAQSSYNTLSGRNLAEPAVAQGEALAEQVVNGTVPGLASPTPYTLLSQPPQVPSGCLSYLTFDAANPLGLPYSTDNLAGKTTVSGYGGQVVPPSSVELVGIGRSGASEIHIVVIVYVPAWPYVVAASDCFTGSGVTVAQATGLPTTCPSAAPSVAACAYLPGDLVSNSGLGSAICLLATRVTGNVQAPGGIQMCPASKVCGAIEIGAAAVPLPLIAATSNPLTGYGGVQPFPTPTGCLTLSGFVSALVSPCGCCITVPGSLNSNGAVVVVHGNLCIQGALIGTGSIWTSGRLTVNGGASLTTSDMMALVAEGNLTLNSGPCQPSNFVGLVYTGGNLQASNMHLFGNLVANGNGVAGKVAMSNTTVVGLPNNALGLTLGGTVLGNCRCHHGEMLWKLSCNCGTKKFCLIPPRPVVCLPPYKVLPPCIKPFCVCFQPCGKVQMNYLANCHLVVTACGNFCCPTCLIGFILVEAHLACPCPCRPYRPAGPSCQWPFFKCACGALRGFRGKCPRGPSLIGPLHRMSVVCSCNPAALFNFNFNQFLVPADRVRVLLWREDD